MITNLIVLVIMIYIKIIRFIKLTIRKINKVFFNKTMKYIQTIIIKSTIRKTYTVVLIMKYIQTIIKLTNKKIYTVVLIIIMS